MTLGDFESVFQLSQAL